ncbi:MAG: VWA domain-containing protein, partial [Anaerolineae bacterium]
RAARSDLHLSGGLAGLYSPSHEVSTEQLGPGRARLSWEARSTTPTEDFELFYAPAEAGFGGGLLTGRREESEHFLFVFSPETELKQADALPKDIVFVIDRSGSMSGEKIKQARDALSFIVGQLGERDRFSIVAFDDRVQPLEHTLQPVDGPSLRDARRFVDRLSADGATDIEAALQSGLEILDRSGDRGASQMVVFLTDGLPTEGITDGDAIARLVAATNARLEARLHVFGVGYDVNTHLLDRLAADNGGTVTYVQEGENVEVALTSFYAKIAHPVLTGIEIEFEGLEASDLYPQVLPDLFQGSSLLLAGRYRAQDGEVSMRVRGWAGDERREVVYHLDLDEATDQDFVPRLWATRRVGALLDQVRVEGESEALVAEIRELGLAYGIVTPYTAFIIEGQSSGAASSSNMDLYNRNGLSQASGETTVQARVQNLTYQQAAQANLATGANVKNWGQRSLAQVGAQQVDLSLLRGKGEGDVPVSDAWLDQNVEVDRTVTFGSEAYFA